MTSKNLRNTSFFLSLLTAFFVTAGSAYAGQSKETKYPVILAHGMAGGGPIIGTTFTDDIFLTKVTNSCNRFLEIICNRWLAPGQENNNKATAFTVTPFQSSDYRGLELADHIENFMATTGHKKVNLIGHSQGGMDIRKASYELKSRSINGVKAGKNKVASMISIASPHRGSAIPKAAMDSYTDDNLVLCDAVGMNCELNIDVNGQSVDPILHLLRVFMDHNMIFTSGDFQASLLALQYDDYFPNDGIATGSKQFNKNYGIKAADFAASIVTGQDQDDLVSFGLKSLARMSAIDGDGYCVDDCDGDGAGGNGDGHVWDDDNDNIVSLNSQQMGVRLAYHPREFSCRWEQRTKRIWFATVRYSVFVCDPDKLDTFSVVASTGKVKNLNKLNHAQMTSHDGKLLETHLGVVGAIPDAFDESEFYAALFNFIAKKGH